MKMNNFLIYLEILILNIVISRQGKDAPQLW